MDQGETWHLGRPLPWPHCVRWPKTDRTDRQDMTEDRTDRQTDTQNQQSASIGRTVFGRPFVKRFVICYRSVVLSVLSVTLAYCGQTVGWIKMKLGVQVGIGPGHIVLDGDPASPPPNFRPMSIVANRLDGSR